MLHVSGVLALVVLGITLSSNRTSISPEVEKFLHRCDVYFLILFTPRLAFSQFLKHEHLSEHFNEVFFFR